MQNLLIPSLVRSIHNIFTSIWIGGMAAILFSFTPAIKNSVEDRSLQHKITVKMISYQSKWVYAGIVLLTVTGILMSRLSGKVSRPFDFTNTYAAVLSIKHILVIAVSLIAIVRSRMFRRNHSKNMPGKNRMGTILLTINTVLGFVVLVLSSINAILQ